jgi:hypothetical protein
MVIVVKQVKAFEATGGSAEAGSLVSRSLRELTDGR